VRANERLRGLADLLASAVSGSVKTVADMHAAIARYPFRVLESVPVVQLPATAARVLHDGIAGGVYGTLRGATWGAGVAARAALAPLAAVPLDRGRPSPPPLDLAIAALNGVVGDRLAERRNGLRIEMQLRHAGRRLRLQPAALTRTVPEASPKLAVFVHGLASSEAVWRFYAEEHYGDPDASYGSLLARDLGYTPLYLRYNSGLHVSENGAQLDERMAELVRAWPVPVEEIALVGHSMGGLVVRSACHAGGRRAGGWVEAVRHVVCLGTPHLGAPLEKFGNLAGWLLGALDVTKPLARIVNGRSAGIKDLRYGYVVEEDWRGRDADALLEDNRHDIPFLDSAMHYFVAATLTRSPRHPLALLLGDTLVRVPSASGRGAPVARRIPFRDENGHHVGALSHLRLLNHPAVYAQLRAWLGRGNG
jgi:pimeloyl-ACP methyl ester carboxylesterase